MAWARRAWSFDSRARSGATIPTASGLSTSRRSPTSPRLLGQSLRRWRHSKIQRDPSPRLLQRPARATANSARVGQRRALAGRVRSLLHRFTCRRLCADGQFRQELLSQDSQALDIVHAEPIDDDLLNAGRFVRANFLNDGLGNAIDHLAEEGAQRLEHTGAVVGLGAAAGAAGASSEAALPRPIRTRNERRLRWS